MNAEEIEDVFTSTEFNQIFSTQENFQPGDILEYANYIEISLSGIFPVYQISSKFKKESRILDVVCNDGREVGQLILTKGQILDDFYSLSRAEFLGYLVDVPRENFGELGYVFSQDFLITSDVSASEYNSELRGTADIWGGFSHFHLQSGAERSFPNIVARSDIAIPSLHHAEAFARYTHARNPFERFLRLYHCIELLFDLITVLKIKKLNSDIRDFSVILSDHGSKEIERLAAISREFLYDHESMASKFTLISGQEAIAKKIFDDHSKQGNPLPPNGNPPRWSSVIGSFSNARFRKSDLLSDGALKSQEDYSLFVSKIAAYWIYRVRCSIAHNRIGEFILSDADVVFVSEFMEPLLLEFCSQVFSSQALKDLL